MALSLAKLVEGRTPPKWLRKLEAISLTAVFADAFDVEPPRMESMSADRCLTAFREFTAACMEAALEDARVARYYRDRLGERAFKMGSRVREVLGVGDAQAFAVTQFFYRGIDIEVEGDFDADLKFVRCSFAQRYSPADCWFMSAFDDGFMRGIGGLSERELVFSCRLSEGAECCRAQLLANEGGPDA